MLVMAYGTPKDLDGVEAYYTDIRGGRIPSLEALGELRARYAAIGGRSPLLETTIAQARGIEERLGIPVFVGQKHAAPFIADAVRELVNSGATRAVGIVLAPHYSKLSVGDYENRVREAAAEWDWNGSFEMVANWHLETGYIDLLERYVKEALARVGGDRSRATVVFTAHSLPAAIVRAGDPYAEQLTQTAVAVARRLALARWRIGWQSAGRTADEWLGPDVLEIIEELAVRGEEAVVICPCGFVSDHLEVLYDLDIECAAKARDLRIRFARTRSPNADPDFLDTLAGVVKRAIAA